MTTQATRAPEMPRGGWAFVDVETTGTNPAWDRVLSVSVIAFGAQGEPTGEFHSLFDPGCDPGPVWIHGLTKERLRGSPMYTAHAATIAELLAGRILVAHNAQFDYRFLHAESRRAALELPTTHRLCTLALSRRLDLPIENHKLGTVAKYWGVEQLAAHDSRDDVRVLREIFHHQFQLAQHLGLQLPVVACTDRGAAVYAARVTRTPSIYRNPRAWVPPAPLVQGMKVVITGPTATARETLASELVGLGFDVMNSVSGQTRFLICGDPGHQSRKAEKARELGVPFLSEAELRLLLTDVRPGVPRDQPEPRAKASRRVEVPAGPWQGQVVLVLGGDHVSATQARARLGELGARVLVSLGASTTHVLVLPGGERDPRMAKVAERKIPVVGPDAIEGGPNSKSETPDTAVTVLTRGGVTDVPDGSRRVVASAEWATTQGFEVDVVAFAVQDDFKVAADEDFVFYNAPSTPDGGVQLTVDGDCQQGILIDLDSLPSGCSRVVVAAAVDGSATFGDVGPIRLTFAEADRDADFAIATLDAATDERSLVLAEVYLRGDVWRTRAVGQGYVHGLGELVAGMGVEVE